VFCRVARRESGIGATCKIRASAARGAIRTLNAARRLQNARRVDGAAQLWRAARYVVKSVALRALCAGRVRAYVAARRVDNDCYNQQVAARVRRRARLSEMLRGALMLRAYDLMLRVTRYVVTDEARVIERC